MKFSLPIKLLFATLLLLTWSLKVFALAGFSEINSVLYYNRFANIMWGHPSDACFLEGYNCFYLIEKNKLAHPFNGALEKISIPANPNSPFVLMKSTREQWIIYDLELKGILFESSDFESVYKKWKDWHFHELKFANTINLSDYFQETEESKEKNKTNWDETFWLVMLFIFYLHWKWWLLVSSIFLGIVYLLRRRYNFHILR